MSSRALSPSSSSKAPTPGSPVQPSFLLLLERSTLRFLYSILYHLDPHQTQFAVNAFVQSYNLVSQRFPKAVGTRLDAFVDNLLKHAEPEFIELWTKAMQRPTSPVEPVELPPELRGEASPSPSSSQSTNLAIKLYQSVADGLHTVFACILFTRPYETQTPCTSPQHQTRQGRKTKSTSKAKSGPTRPTGRAIRYMEMESTLPPAVTRHMQQFMHSVVPLNLFHAVVHYDTLGEDETDVVEGVISPESFPPTPIGRQYHSQRMAIYTSTILDRANQELERMCAQES